MIWWKRNVNDKFWWRSALCLTNGAYVMLDSKILQNILQTELPWCYSANGTCNTFLFRYRLKKNMWTDLSSILSTWSKANHTHICVRSINQYYWPRDMLFMLKTLWHLLKYSQIQVCIKNRTRIWHLKLASYTSPGFCYQD